MSFSRLWALVMVGWLCGLGASCEAQGPKPRLAAAISSSAGRVALPGTRPAQAYGGVDQGPVASGTAIKGVTLVFRRSDAQETDLQALLAAQQNTASPLYHQWLTPDQFAVRFGVADSDIAKVETWLQGQGFAIDGVARSRNSITFDGTAGQMANAFGAELHRYALPDKVHFAPANDLSLPAALAPMVTSVLHLADFHAHSQKVLRPAYTSSRSPGNHFLAPSDIATMYDIKPLTSAGYNGTGQAIAVLGETYIDTSAVSAFQSGLGLPANLPTQVLVQNTGVAGINPLQDGDEGESQLDVEYAAGIATGAKVFLVYTGDSANSNGVFDSLTFAVDSNIAPVLTGSYGFCEQDLTQGGVSAFANVYQQQVEQASAQGQTVIFSSGDSGSTDCYGYSNFNTAQQEALSASFPASIPYVTALGGTQMQTGTYTASLSDTQYWQGASGSDTLSSLLSYVPETVWNEDSALAGLSAGGGGASTVFGRPSWQTGVPGIPSGATRLLPDVSLQASTDSPGYLYCTTDVGDLGSLGVSASCTNGLRSPAGTFTLAGGTSFSAPIFAGMLAVLNQAKNATGQGNINPILYGLASNATTYASAFHDITTGTNACTAGTSFCSTTGASQYAATTGFDEATGLGSVDLAKLVAAWPAATTGTAGAVGSTTTLSPATLTPASGATDAVTITVAAVGGSVTPTGTVTVYVDGSTTGTALALSGGRATYTYPGTSTGGAHILVAKYAGDTNTLPSQGSVALTLAGSTAATGAFTLSAQNISVGYNGTAQGTIAITPSAGYTGTVALTLTYSSTAVTLCYDTTSDSEGASNFTLGAGALTAGNATGILEVGEGTRCGTSASGAVVLRGGQNQARLEVPTAPRPTREWPKGIAFAGLLFAGLAFRRSRRLPSLLGLLLLSGLGLGLTGCGGNNGTTTTNPVNTTQTVTATLTGTDTVTGAITASTTLTITVHP